MSKKNQDVQRVYESVTAYIKSNIFRSPIKNFVDEYCINFNGTEENTFESTMIHNNFKLLIESLLIQLLEEIGVDQDTFLSAAKKGLESEDKKFYEQLIACDNFLYFKNMMIKRNMQLEEEAMKLMQSKGGDITNKLLTVPEYEFYTQRKYETEMECAIQMSLALEDEKKRLLALEEEELRRAIELSRIANKDNPDWNEEKELSLFGDRIAALGNNYSGNYYVGSYVTDVSGIPINNNANNKNQTEAANNSKGSGSSQASIAKGADEKSTANSNAQSASANSNLNGNSSANQNPNSGVNVNVKNNNPISNTIHIGGQGSESTGAQGASVNVANDPNNPKGGQSANKTGGDKDINISLNVNLQGQTGANSGNNANGLNLMNDPNNPGHNVWKTSLNKVGNFDLTITGKSADSAAGLDKQGANSANKVIELTEKLSISGQASNSTGSNSGQNDGKNSGNSGANSNYNANSSVIGQDAKGNPIYANNPIIAYDAKGNPIYANSNITGYDSKGNPIFANNPITGYDAKGNPIYANNGVIGYDAKGNPIFANNPIIGYDAKGNPIYANNPITGYDAKGKPIYANNNILGYDAKGNPIYANNPIIGYDAKGNPIYANNNIITGYDAKGNPIYSNNPITGYDVKGNPIYANHNIVGYDAKGNPIYASNTILGYDAKGNPIYATSSQDKNTQGSGNVVFGQSVITESISTGNKTGSNNPQASNNNLISLDPMNSKQMSSTAWANMNPAEKLEYEKMMKINHDMPNLSGVKSKIDTGLRRTKEVVKDTADAELNKKYQQIQKDNQEKLKDYREMILKMKQEKRNTINDPKKKAPAKK